MLDLLNKVNNAASEVVTRWMDVAENMTFKRLFGLSVPGVLVNDLSIVGRAINNALAHQVLIDWS